MTIVLGCKFHDNWELIWKDLQAHFITYLTVLAIAFNAAINHLFLSSYLHSHGSWWQAQKHAQPLPVLGNPKKTILLDVSFQILFQVRDSKWTPVDKKDTLYKRYHRLLYITRHWQSLSCRCPRKRSGWVCQQPSGLQSTMHTVPWSRDIITMSQSRGLSSMLRRATLMGCTFRQWPAATSCGVSSWTQELASSSRYHHWPTAFHVSDAMQICKSWSLRNNACIPVCCKNLAHWSLNTLSWCVSLCSTAWGAHRETVEEPLLPETAFTSSTNVCWPVCLRNLVLTQEQRRGRACANCN